ncbi:peptidoglycan DD-metalloendopeptidase family protein [Rheinheimera texasensis]|uniref:peptidoglycan DD-metalloendopeptidase family protein n=1 Tax=Rheinheimera texasensis TaxID=306205 RepID=UPI00068F36BE|nr:peptidoglycan DD-metalloendopeptidase family protein [Rheinheimera texasensis]
MRLLLQHRQLSGAGLLLGWLLLLAGCASAPPVTPPPVAEKTVTQQRGPVTFVHPLPGARISASFARYIIKSRNRQHHGVDFAAPSGTPVFAASAGVVLSADNSSLSEAFGNAVLIEHGDQLTSLSAHLSRLDVQIGQWVEAGQQIGLVGQTGRATGPHLHFELWRGSVPQDPIALLPLNPQERKQALAEMQRQAAASQTPAKKRVAVAKKRTVTGKVAKTTPVKKATPTKKAKQVNTAAKAKAPVGNVAVTTSKTGKTAAPVKPTKASPAKTSTAKASAGE